MAAPPSQFWGSVRPICGLHLCPQDVLTHTLFPPLLYVAIPALQMPFLSSGCGLPAGILSDFVTQALSCLCSVPAAVGLNPSLPGIPFCFTDSRGSSSASNSQKPRSQWSSSSFVVVLAPTFHSADLWPGGWSCPLEISFFYFSIFFWPSL